jgi:hypothetical protein
MVLMQLLLALLLTAAPAIAQQVYTIPQTLGPITCINAAVAPTTSSTTPGAATFIKNIGQISHTLTYTTSGTITSLQIEIDGSDDGTHWGAISNTATATGGGGVQAAIYKPYLRCNLVAVTGGGSVTAYYTGAAATAGPTFGIYSASGVYSRVLATADDATANNTYAITSPTGQTGGLIFLKANAGGSVAGCGVTLSAGPDSTHTQQITTFTIAASGSSGPSLLTVPNIPEGALSLTVSCAAIGSGTYYLSYQFSATVNPLNHIWYSTFAQFLPEVACDLSQPITISGAGTLKIIPANGTQVTRICHISAAFAGATDFTVVRGTGSNCGTNQSNITGAYKNIVTIALDWKALAAVESGGSSATDVCITTSGAVAGGGIVTYAQSPF